MGLLVRLAVSSLLLSAPVLLSAPAPAPRNLHPIRMVGRWVMHWDRDCYRVELTADGRYTCRFSDSSGYWVTADEDRGNWHLVGSTLVVEQYPPRSTLFIKWRVPLDSRLRGQVQGAYKANVWFERMK